MLILILNYITENIELILQTLDINNDAFSNVFNCSISSKNISTKPTSYTKTSRTDKSSCSCCNPFNKEIYIIHQMHFKFKCK